MDGVTRLAPGACDAALDLEALKALETALGPEESAELIDDGILEATDRLVAIEQALDAPGWAGAARAARELGAIAARMGMAPLADQAGALEECCQRLDHVAAQAVGRRLLRTGEAMLSASLFRPPAV